jgi:diaminopimelate decarboxylase
MYPDLLCSSSPRGLGSGNVVTAMATTRDARGDLCLGGVRLETLAGDPAIGTPTYVYDLSAIALEARELRESFDAAPHLVTFAVKANSAGPVVRALANEGCGADVVSGSELALALACGVSPDDVVYSGVAKIDDEIDRAIFAGPRGIGALQVESVEEISRVEARAAAAGRLARVAIRVNPGVDLAELHTHEHIATGHDDAKFGVARDDVPAALSALRAARHTELVGLGMHIGSQLTSVGAYVEASRTLFRLVADIPAEQKKSLAFVDTGGGFGVDYGGGPCVRPGDFVRAVRAQQRALGLEDLTLHVEPGRSLVAAHGVLLARVLQSKVSHVRKGSLPLKWLLIDAGMNDLLRPALYRARHRVVPLAPAPGPDSDWRVVGPVCESSDDFGTHVFPDSPPAFVAILDAGAYGYTMASTYNGRALPAEIFLEKGRVVDRRARGSIEEWISERVSGNSRAPKRS